MTAEEIAPILAEHSKWLAGPGGSRANLSGANLRDANLRDANLRDADLSGANLIGANLRYADLSGANLIGANLRYADLRDADLSGASLSGASLSWANLSGANLRDADLSGANLSGANLIGANLRYADLRDADFRGAQNLPLVASIPDFRSQVLAAVSRDDCSIAMQSWHTCETVHCLAGWVVTIHPEGRLLESMLTTPTAAALILHACGEQIPNFFDTGDGAEERAMNWLRTGKQE